jgi:hypothetical protein
MPAPVNSPVIHCFTERCTVTSGGVSLDDFRMRSTFERNKTKYLFLDFSIVPVTLGLSDCTFQLPMDEKPSASQTRLNLNRDLMALIEGIGDVHHIITLEGK